MALSFFVICRLLCDKMKDGTGFYEKSSQNIWKYQDKDLHLWQRRQSKLSGLMKTRCSHISFPIIWEIYALFFKGADFQGLYSKFPGF